MDGGKEEVDVLGLKVEGAAGAVIEEGLDQFAFAFLELVHAFLDGADGEEAIDEHGFFLADAMGAVHGLGFDPFKNADDFREIKRQKTEAKASALRASATGEYTP